MPRLVVRKLTVRKPPAAKASKVVLRKPPKLVEVSLVDRPARKAPHIVNVIKKPPRPAEKAQAKEALINERIAARNRYREKAGVTFDSCLDNLEQLDEMAHTVTVTLPNGKVREIQGFTVTGLGGPLKTSGATVTRWLKRNMLPQPFLETSRGKVYHIEEVRVMLRVIGKHQLEFRQYRDDHEEVKDKLFAEINKLRRSLFPAK